MILSNIPTEFPPVKISSRRVGAIWEAFEQTKAEKPKEITVLPEILPENFPKSMENQLFVSLDGCDECGDGSIGNPYATIAYALSKVGKTGGVIWVRGGAYPPFSLTAENSGLTDAPLFISAYKDEKVTVIAGHSIAPERFVAVDDADFVSPDDKAVFNTFKAGNSRNIYALDLKAAGISQEEFNDYKTGCKSAPVFVGDTAYHVARWPNMGENNEEMKIQGGRVKTMSVAPGAKNLRYTGRPTSPLALLYPEHKDDPQMGWSYFIDDTTYVDHVTKYKNPYNNLYIWGSVYEEWSNEPYHVTVYKENGETVMEQIGEDNYYGAKVDAGAALYFHNMPEDLDSEEEYLIDIHKMILYVYGKPTEAVTITTSEVNLLTVKEASYVVVNGIDCKYVPKTAIYLDNTKEVFVQNADITGADIGIFLQNCYMSGLLYSTVTKTRISVWTDFNRAETKPTCNIIQNNTFGEYGSLQDKSSTLYLGGGFGDVVSHNKMIESGCSVLFQFDLIFEYNESIKGGQYNHDAGTVYGHVSCRGMHIRYNWIHDICYNTCGIYLDDMSAGNYIYGNTIHFKKYPWWNRCINFTNGAMNVTFNNLCINAGVDGAIVNQPCYVPRFINDLEVGECGEAAGNWKSINNLFMYDSYHAMNEEVMKSRYPMYAYHSTFVDRTKEYIETHPDWNSWDKKSPEEDDEIFIRLPALNIYKNNVMYACGRGITLPKLGAETCTVEGNLSYGEKTDLSFVDKDNMDYTLKPDSIVFEEMPDFEPLYPMKAGLTQK